MNETAAGTAAKIPPTSRLPEAQGAGDAANQCGMVGMQERRSMTTETRQLTLVKKGHFYLFRYGSGQEATLIQTLIEKAEDPKCPLDWFDAAVLSHQMGHRMAGQMQKLLKTKLGMSGGYKKG